MSVVPERSVTVAKTRNKSSGFDRTRERGLLMRSAVSAPVTAPRRSYDQAVSHKAVVFAASPQSADAVFIHSGRITAHADTTQNVRMQ